MNDDVALRRLLIAAAREFNAGHFFEAHEVLEDGLDQVPNALWDLFIGLIQIAVGYHKATQRLWSGARRMLGLGLEKLERFPDDAVTLNLSALRQRVRADVETLAAGSLDIDALRRHPPRLQPSAS